MLLRHVLDDVSLDACVDEGTGHYRSKTLRVVARDSLMYRESLVFADRSQTFCMMAALADKKA